MSLAAQDTGREPTREQAITVAGPGPVAVVLTREVYESAREDLGDLRVTDGDGRLVPYLIDRAEVVERTEPVAGTLSNRTFVPGRSTTVTLVFDRPVMKRALQLSLSGENFRRRVQVEGRAKAPEPWQTLTDDAYVFAVPAPSAARYETVPLPENDFAELRVTVFHDRDDPPRLEIRDATVRAAERRRPAEASLSPRLVRSEDAKSQDTLLTLDLGARHQPFVAFVLDVGDVRFFRGVAVEARRDAAPPPPGYAAPPPSWTPLGEGAIYRYGTERGDREMLRVDVSGRERVVRLRIRNRDDAPLGIASVAVMAPVERVVFEAQAGKRYALRYGAPALSAPQFDFARTAGDPTELAARASEGRLAPPSRIAAAPPPPPPWTERHPALLWTGLLAVVAALGLVTWRALRAAA